MNKKVIGRATLYCGDCLDVLPHIENIACVLTDPPYGLGKKWTGGTWFKNGVFEDESMDWDSEANQEWFDTIYDLRVPMIWWGANYYIVPPTQCWFIWQKPQFPTMGDFEMAWSNLNQPSKTFKHNRNGWKKDHPTHKPLDLLKWCLKQIEKHYDIQGAVFDPFMGSGSTGDVAIHLGYDFVGIEKDPERFETACRRLENLQASMGKIKHSNPKGLLF